ncbi:MAG: class I SAM-dependent methyltransferase [Acidobacteriaceae bacterium]
MNKKLSAPDSTAVRVALWRAQHMQIDPEPHLLEDEIGLRLIDPDSKWRSRPDMKGSAATRFRAGIVIRTRFVEDLLAEQVGHGVRQYVILGAGLDTFAQRNPSLAARLQVFEIDQPGPQQWKQQRLTDRGFRISSWLHFVPVDFERGDPWLDQLIAAGFVSTQPAVIASTGVSMYLTKEAIASTLRQVATLAPGTTFVMTFLLPPKTEKAPKPTTRKATRKSKMPFISFFTPEEMLALAREARFKEVRHLSGTALTHRYFPRRPDLPSSSAEEMLIATT